MDENRLTVFIPCYNSQQYIQKTLDSLKAQTYQYFKVCIIDDGSTDDTRNIVIDNKEEYWKDNLHYHYKENGGISDARNMALSMVDTEYFTFLDSDDYVEPSYYEKMIQKADHDDAQLVACGFYWEYPNKSIPVLEGPYTNKKEMLINMYATLWNKIYRTKWIKSMGIEFPFGLRYEDASFLYRIVPKVERVSFVEEPMIHYVQREGSITHTYNVNIKDMIEVFKGINKYYEDINEKEQYIDELEYLHIRFFLGNSFLRTSQINDGKLRKELLNMSWGYFTTTFPNWKRNPYLKKSGKKNIYYRYTTETTFYLVSRLVNYIYKFKKVYK